MKFSTGVALNSSLPTTNLEVNPKAWLPIVVTLSGMVTVLILGQLAKAQP